MIPIPLYLTSVQANLETGFLDFQREIALWVGYGVDSSNWTADQTAELNRDVEEAYRWVLYPSRVLEDRVPHVWSWRTQRATITTEEDEYQYTLPIDFGSMMDQHIFWPLNSGYPPIKRVSDSQILLQRQYGTNSGKPYCFAVRWLGLTAGQRQRQEVILYPTPDGEYTLNYRYALQATPLNATNPFPLGGPEVGQLVMEACRAIGEHKKNGERGEQWNVFRESLESAVMLDRSGNVDTTVGVMRGAVSGDCVPDYQRAGSYYFGPDASYGSSLYQLET